MSFGSLEVASIPRTQDYTTMKQNEDNKGAFQQMTLGEHAQKQSEQRTREVHSSDNADWYTGQYDAKEKGKNEYAGNGGKHRKKENSEKDGVVVTNRRRYWDMWNRILNFSTASFGLQQLQGKICPTGDF